MSPCVVPTVKADEIPGEVTHEIVNTEPPYVMIKWEPPRSPNGLIILYEVFYRKVGESEVSVKHLHAFREEEAGTSPFGWGGGGRFPLGKGTGNRHDL